MRFLTWFRFLVYSNIIAIAMAKEVTSSLIEFVHKEYQESNTDDGVTMKVTTTGKEKNGSTAYYPKKWYFKLPLPTNKSTASYGGGEKATFLFNSKGLVKTLTVAGTKYKFKHKKNKKNGYFELKSAACVKNCENKRYLLGSNDGEEKHTVEELHLLKYFRKENRRLDTSCGICNAAVTAICTDGFVNQFKTCVKVASRIPAGPAAVAVTLLCAGVTATFCYLGSEVVCDLVCDDDACDPINQKECDGKCVDRDWCCTESGDTYCNDGSNVCIPKDSTECCPSQVSCGPNDASYCISKDACCVWTDEKCGCPTLMNMCFVLKNGPVKDNQAVCYVPEVKHCCSYGDLRCVVDKGYPCEWPKPYGALCSDWHM